MIILIVLVLLGFVVMMYDFNRVSAELALINKKVTAIEARIIANEVVYGRHPGP